MLQAVDKECERIMNLKHDKAKIQEIFFWSKVFVKN